MDGKTDPDYASCVALCTKGALHEMVVPALLAIIVPIVTGLVLGPTGVVGLLGRRYRSAALPWPCSCPTPAAPGITPRSISSPATTAARAPSSHKAAVVGDTVGDPFKDTSGPSLNILIKLLLHGLHRVLRLDPGLQPDELPVMPCRRVPAALGGRDALCPRRAAGAYRGKLRKFVFFHRKRP